MTVTSWPPSSNTFRDLLRLTSSLRYVAWVMAGRRSGITLIMKDSLKLHLRAQSRLATDFGVAYELFVHDMYRPALKLDRNAVKSIVDLGGNAGFSVLRFLSWFPNSHVIVVEPHPAHAQALRDNVALNGWTGRVDLRQVAAGTGAGRAMLSDEGASSSLRADQGIDVELIDVFDLLLGRSIDILKIDIEGAEHPILSDPRFGQVKAKSILLEWHNTTSVPNARQRCLDKLLHMNYAVEESFVQAQAGMIYGHKG